MFSVARISTSSTVAITARATKAIEAAAGPQIGLTISENQHRGTDEKGEVQARDGYERPFGWPRGIVRLQASLAATRETPDSEGEKDTGYYKEL